MKKFVLILMLCSFCLNAEQSEKLIFEQVYLRQGEQLLRPLPKIETWRDDSHYAEERDEKIFLVEASNGHDRVLFDPGPVKKSAPAGIDWLHPDDRTADYLQLAFIHEGDIYLYQKKSGLTRRLTATPGVEKNPGFSPDGRYLAYTLAGNLFVCPTTGGESIPLTLDGNEEILNGYASWVYYEEILGRGSRYRAFYWSPDSRKIAFLRFDQRQVPQFPLFDAMGTYGRLEMQRYPKPGFPNPAVKIGVIDLAGRQTEWISFAEGPDHYLTFLDWSPDGKKFYLQWLNRGQDELQIYEYTLDGKIKRQVYMEKQKAWIDFLKVDDFAVLTDGDFVLRSSKDGWDHLYCVTNYGGEKKLTDGEWSVKKINHVDERRGLIYFSAARQDSTATDLYVVPLASGSIKRLTIFSGTNDVTFSPQGSFFLNRYSSLQKPSRLQLCDRHGREVRLLGDSVTQALSRYLLAKTELFRIPSTDGFQLPAIWYLPPGFDPAGKYPVVVSIYGGPGIAQVSNSFPRRLNDYFLAQQGIIVLKVDHRGSGHFGKQAMAAMHRCLGKWEIHDYTQAVRYLRGLPFVNKEKIGITGGSYGGYVAALAMVSAPDYFTCGIADFAVSDWLLYDSVYTERYMDLPAENPEGYRQASVLSHVSTYCGDLRLTHGSMDDNVHFQNTLQLLNAVLDQGKTVELMVYPGERHGFNGKKVAEYARSSLDFWRRKFFSQEEIGLVRPARPVGQE